jgi:predicted alpha/beta hydrolase family esterase
MKAIIFHGTDNSPTDYWYGWLKAELERAGLEVELPHYPELNREQIDNFLPKVLQGHSFTDDTVLVGHSAGAPLILSLLEHISGPVACAFLVAGYSRRLTGERDPVLQKSYDWDRIKQNVHDMTFINSVVDPWGCDAEQGRVMFEQLGGTQIIRNEGHFGSTTYNQPYPTFPLLKALILGSRT